MKISTRIRLGFLFLGLLVLLCGASGYYGVSQLSRSLDYLSGPAWDSADGAMEGSIELEAQMIAAKNLVLDIEVERNQQRLADARAAADAALGRMAGAGLLEPARVEALMGRHEDYKTKLDDLLGSYERFRQRREAFDSHTAQFVQFYTELEEVGDGAVEALGAEPDQGISWNGGLLELWTAADGGMESNIGYLRQLYFLEQMTSGADSEECQRGLQEALDLQTEAANEMLGTGRFDVSASSRPGQTIAQVYRNFFDHHIQEVQGYMEEFRAFKAAESAYIDTANDMLSAIVDMEGMADALVEDEVVAIAQTKRAAMMAIFGTLGVSLLIAFLAGFTLTRSISRPIRATIEALEHIAAGDGDLTKRLETNSNDEMGELARVFNQFLDGLQSLVRNISNHATSLRSTSNHLSDGALNLAEGAERTQSKSGTVYQHSGEVSGSMDSMTQATEQLSMHITSVAASFEEMTATVGEIAASAESGAREASQTATLADASHNKIVQLGEAAEQIGRVVEVIQDIAEQTNLLSLNATIEAARAGEAGKGFAVVSTEVKELANQTAAATEGIRNQVTEIQSAAVNAVESIGSISEAIGRVRDASVRIAAAVEEQSMMSRDVATTVSDASTAAQNISGAIAQSALYTQEINSHMQGINDAARQTADEASRTKTTSVEVSTVAEELIEAVGRFRV